MPLVDTSANVPDDQILKIELLRGILCMRYILTLWHWPGHYTLFLLILCYHDGRGRIIQIHRENDQPHIRLSRRLHLRVQKYMQIPRASLFTKWLLSKPIGNTAFYYLSHKDRLKADR
ncbi:hypothetical protein GGI42DRAFT_27509 [Trichoderma sp. SZMC 28013]